MNINKRFLLIFFLAIFTYIFYTITTSVNAAAANCPCVAYELYSCPKNPGCKVVYDKNRKPLNKCGYGTCMRCKTYKCPCTPRTLDCSNACGKPRSCVSDGCGGQTCCAATAPCPPVCTPRTLDCSNACGKPRSCVSDGCGGQTCCAATAPCPPVCTRVCPKGQHCTIATCPARAWCVIAAGTQLCVPNPTATPIPNPCPKRPQGDANCDQTINDADFQIFKSAMKGMAYAAQNYSADFNSDNKVNLLDYEIWRNTFKQ